MYIIPLSLHLHYIYLQSPATLLRIWGTERERGGGGHQVNPQIGPLVIAYSISCTYTPEKYLRNYLFRRLQLSLVTNNALVHTIDLTINTPSLSYKSIVSQSLISLHNSYYNINTMPCTLFNKISLSLTLDEYIPIRSRKHKAVGPFPSQ